MQALSQIRQIDYTVIFARNIGAMRDFYETVMEFPLLRALSDRWIEYRVGLTTLALTVYGARRRPNRARYRYSWRSGSRRRRGLTARRRWKSKA